ncbi:hypothetical protein SLA2020_385500 [Shorea laevis]
MVNNTDTGKRSGYSSTVELPHLRSAGYCNHLVGYLIPKFTVCVKNSLNLTNLRKSFPQLGQFFVLHHSVHNCCRFPSWPIHFTNQEIKSCAGRSSTTACTSPWGQPSPERSISVVHCPSYTIDTLFSFLQGSVASFLTCNY